MALYFSSYGHDEDGAIYCIRKNPTPIKHSFQESLDEMIKYQNSFPCVIDPLTNLNDIDDQKSKRQEAV